MNDILPASSPPTGRVAECHTRAAADRVRAEGMDTGNGRRKLEQSAASWDQRAELLGRLDASFNKREQLDAEAACFRTSQGAEHAAGTARLSVWEGEGGATGSPDPSDEQPQVRRPDGTQARGIQS
jgi:hypothetical protein